jgi:hypothetical protein
MRRIFFILGLTISLTATACFPPKASHQPPPDAPRLVLFLVVDQGRADYFERFASHFSGGIAHLLESSVDFRNTWHQHAMSKTAPGHATIATGSHPARHGIVGNSWFDRATGTTVDSDEDDRYSPAVSPSRLVTTGLAGWVKAAYPESRVFTASLKSRAAVMLGGRDADAALWYDDETGRFTSSDYYPHGSPYWLQEFHEEPLPDRLFGTAWELLPATAAAIEPQGLEEVERGIVRGRMPRPIGSTKTAPTSGYYGDFLGESPFGDAYLGELAWALVENEGLGDDGWPDVLSISFSSLDYIGHRYGPNSPEVLDTLLRLDQVLDLLFQRLDRTIGLDNVLISFTSDHGVAAIPEYSSGRRFWVEERSCVQRAARVLDKKFGRAAWLEADLVLDHAVLSRRNVDAATATSLLADALEACPGVERVWTEQEIAGEAALSDPVGRLFHNSFYPGRSEDLLLQAEAGAILSNIETNHGSAHAFDRQVPWFLISPSLSARRVTVEVATVDIAPTVAEILGVTVPTPHDGTSRLTLARTGDPNQPQGGA